jgi:hypothetical protein
VIVAFAAVLESSPDRADAYLDKSQIDDIKEALDYIYEENEARTRR